MNVLWSPNPGPQVAFLSTTAREVLYGGAAGGGKSDALLMKPLRWIDHPKFRAWVGRREKPDLLELIDRQKAIYPEIDPRIEWSEQRQRWETPWGAFIQMAAAEHEDDILAYKSFQYPMILFDELTTWTKKQYLFMFSRNRIAGTQDLPLQLHSATNPGDIGHAFVFERFIEGRLPYTVYRIPVEVPGVGTITLTRQFIPATVFDNPKLDQREEYIAGLQQMGPELANAMLWGRWDLFEGQFFTAMPEETVPGIKEANYFVIRCLDYGWNDATVVYWLIAYPHSGVIEIADELYVTATTVDDIARMIQTRERLLKQEFMVKAPSTSVADPSIKRKGTDGRQSILDMFARRGVWFEDANNDRPAGWAMLRMLLHSKRLKVWRGRAPWLYKTLPTLRYDNNKKDDIKKGGNDHPADALRYGVVAFFEGSAPEPAKAAKNPLVQDTVYEQLRQRAKEGETADELLQYSGGLL